jgi:hypothetical protein
MVPATLAALDGAADFAFSFGSAPDAFTVERDLTLAAPAVLGAYPGMCRAPEPETDFRFVSVRRAFGVCGGAKGFGTGFDVGRLSALTRTLPSPCSFLLGSGLR